MSQIRREVLNIFKILHRTRQKIFIADERALSEGRKQINENFRKNQNVTDEGEIKQMIQLAREVEKELRTTVIQAVEKQKGLYELRITDETTRLDNMPFNPNAVLQRPKRRARRSSGEEGDCFPCTDATDVQQK